MHVSGIYEVKNAQTYTGDSVVCNKMSPPQVKTWHRSRRLIGLYFTRYQHRSLLTLPTPPCLQIVRFQPFTRIHQGTPMCGRSSSSQMTKRNLHPWLHAAHQKLDAQTKISK